MESTNLFGPILVSIQLTGSGDIYNKIIILLWTKLYIFLKD